jgi:hypothetical protein
MGDKFTVFDENGRPVEVAVPPEVGSGLTWVRGSYHHPTYPSPFDVRVGTGIHAWFLIAELEQARGNYDTVVSAHDGQITFADLEAAVRHYFRYKEDVDAKIAEHRAPVV